MRQLIGFDHRLSETARIRIGLIGLMLVFLVFGDSARAADTPRSGVQVSPLSLEKEVWPGEEVSFAVKFFNPLNYPQNVRPKFKDFMVPRSGEVQFLDYSSPRYTLSRWADFKREVITLGPHEEVTLGVTITVPEDAVMGGHFGALFGEVRGEGGEEGLYQMKQTVAAGTLIFLSVLGDSVGGESWAGELSDFSVGGRSFGGVYVISEPISFRTIFVNRGIFHQNVWGGLSVCDMLGGGVSNFRLQEKKALPGVYVAYNQSWEPPFPIGRYEAKLGVLYGRNGEKEVAKSVKFWVVKPKALLALGAVFMVVVLVFARKRKNRISADN